ncbi:MAG: LLM class flavin-dependent oxidoreductase [Dehalococcoidia bacterium]|nr:LLM class flavin-dependent oxidoreductase [Dehalococcoidia bacterium]
MARMRFGAFLAPHHPIGEHPTLQIQRDLELVAHLDALGYDEFWCGEHHSGGWETIASPEMFLAAAGEKTTRIMLGTGVVSLPYHHPFNVAQRIVQLDHMTRGRAMLGVGPGALPSDARTLGIDPAVQRDRMEEALGVIIRLLREDRPFGYRSDWFEVVDAQLQIKPLQEELPIVVASTISPAGMKAAGRFGVGVISLASASSEGLAALPTQWGFGETYAAEHGQVMDRSKWRINANWHVAPTKDQAIQEIAEGLTRWHNEYNVDILGRPGAEKVTDAHAFATRMANAEGSMIGTPDDLVASIKLLQERSGGFGTLIGFAHDWAAREAQLRSFEMFARYVIPRVQGLLEPVQRSADFLSANKAELMDGANKAVLGAIRAHNATHPKQDDGVAARANG